MKAASNVLKKPYQKPKVKSEKDKGELALNCPTTNTYYCGTAYSPKKG